MRSATNEARGDQFAINQWRFENNETDLSDELEALERSDRVAMYMRYGLIAPRPGNGLPAYPEGWPSR